MLVSMSWFEVDRIHLDESLYANVYTDQTAITTQPNLRIARLRGGMYLNKINRNDMIT
jgi:hypothetical protein